MQIRDLLIRWSRWVLDPSLTVWNSSTRGTYNYTKSPTAMSTDETFIIGYGGGVVGGRIITETVTIAGLTFENVSMGIANTTAPSFLGKPSVGLVGLGPQPTYAQTLPAPFPMSEMNSFALDFKTSGSGLSDEGSIEFGGIDKTKYAGQLAKTSLNHTGGHWSIDGVDFSIGNKRINTNSNVILDTGAGHNIIAPQSVTEAYYSQVPGASIDNDPGGNFTVWLVPCNSTLPDLTLHIGGKGTATVSGSTMIGYPVDATDSSSPTGYCNPSIQNSTAPTLVGFPFFACNYVFFDKADETLSWAPYV